MGCYQQTCLSPHCWHRVVKSCLHGTLRSRKTDKLVSKRTAKSSYKEAFVQRLLLAGEQKHFSQACVTLAAGREMILVRSFLYVACLSCARSLLQLCIHPPRYLLGFISPWLTFSWRHSNTNSRQQVQKSATCQCQVSAKISDRRSRRGNPEVIQVSVALRACWCWLCQRVQGFFSPPFFQCSRPTTVQLKIKDGCLEDVCLSFSRLHQDVTKPAGCFCVTS